MALRSLRIGSTLWIDGDGLGEKEIISVLDQYDIHKLDREACLEENQKARIDTYDNYLFLILYFPKYNPKTERYLLNEFNIFLGSDFLITFRKYPTTHINDLFEHYSTLVSTQTARETISPGYILYEVIHQMEEKMLAMTKNIQKDLRKLEDIVFQWSTSGEQLAREIMIRQRNIITLKHMLTPQITVLKTLEMRVNSRFQDDIEVYFEDVQDKLEQVVQDIHVFQENLDSIEDAFKSMIEMETNEVIKTLTLFSSLMLPLTVITGFYGMNVEHLPWSHSPWAPIFLMIGSIVAMIVGFFLFQKYKKWIQMRRK